MPRDRCSDTGETDYFCPADYLTRRDLVRLLALVVDSEEVEGTFESAFIDLPLGSDIGPFVAWMAATGAIPLEDPNCPSTNEGRRFCPDQPAYRVDAAYWMTHIFGLVAPERE